MKRAVRLLDELHQGRDTVAWLDIDSNGASSVRRLMSQHGQCESEQAESTDKALHGGSLSGWLYLPCSVPGLLPKNGVAGR
jgi:hypothetical protein